MPIVCGYYIYDSPDGFVWRRRPDMLMSNTIVTDNAFCHGYDEELGAWIFWMQARNSSKFRTMGVSITRDIEKIPFPREILTPDEQDPPECQFNHLASAKVPGGFVGLVVDFRPQEGCKKEPQLAFSRDAVAWDRTAGREPFIPAGEPGSWDEMNVFVANPVQAGDTVYILYHGSITGNGSWFPLHKDGKTEYVKTGSWGTVLPDGRLNLPGIGMATLRRDRWAALKPVKKKGFVETKRMYWAGGELFVNCDAREGSLTAELIDHKGKPVSGFTRRECDPFSGDDLNHRMSWKGKNSLPPEFIGTAQKQGTEGRTMAIRFYLDRARLYSLSC